MPVIRKAARSYPALIAAADSRRPTSTIHLEGSSTGYRTAQIPKPLAFPSTEEQYLGVPLALVRNLVEVYYTFIGNASLLLHKGSFLGALGAGRASPHVVLSVCALASK